MNLFNKFTAITDRLVQDSIKREQLIEAKKRAKREVIRRYKNNPILMRQILADLDTITLEDIGEA